MTITRLILNRLTSFLNSYNVIITSKRRILKRHSIALGTGRKGVVYLMGYLIPYPLISYHGTVSRGVIPDPLERYGLRNY